MTFTIRNGEAGDTSNNRQDAKGVKVQLSDSVNFELANGTCAPGLDGTFVLCDARHRAEFCTVYREVHSPERGPHHRGHAIGHQRHCIDIGERVAQG